MPVLDGLTTLTVGYALDHGVEVCAGCDHCRCLVPIRLDQLRRELDLLEALMDGRIVHRRRCRQPARALYATVSSNVGRATLESRTWRVD